MHIEKSRQTYMGKYFLDAAREKGFPIHDTNARQGEGTVRFISSKTAELEQMEITNVFPFLLFV